MHELSPTIQMRWRRGQQLEATRDQPGAFQGVTGRQASGIAAEFWPGMTSLVNRLATDGRLGSMLSDRAWGMQIRPEYRTSGHF